MGTIFNDDCLKVVPILLVWIALATAIRFVLYICLNLQ
jgi:hypothetical protein